MVTTAWDRLGSASERTVLFDRVWLAVLEFGVSVAPAALAALRGMSAGDLRALDRRLSAAGAPGDVTHEVWTAVDRSGRAAAGAGLAVA